MSNKKQERLKLWSFVSTDILGRAFLVALGLGTVLTLINQPGAILGVDPVQVLSLILVYLTPFVVVTISQVLGVHRATMDLRSGRAPAPHNNVFLTTAMSHGIPLRALLVALLIGSMSTFVVASGIFVANGTLSDMPILLTMQAFALPMLFGLISQTISYRRAVTVIGQPHQPSP